jgi:hypothetical protein
MGIPYLFLKNYEWGIARNKEKSEWFNKLKDRPVESIRLRVWSNADSLLKDSVITNREVIGRLKTEYLGLPENFNSRPRLIWTKRIELTFVQNNRDSLNSTVYIIQCVALIFIQTESARDFEGLDDLYANENLKKVFADL